MHTIFLKRYNLTIYNVTLRVALLVIDKTCHKTKKSATVVDIKGNTLSLHVSDFRVNMLSYISGVPRKKGLFLISEF